MRKLILYFFLMTMFGCSTTAGISSERELMKYTYNDYLSFEFSVPLNSIDILPKHLNNNSNFYDDDVERNSQNILWLLNRTYGQVRTRTFSGKYSIRVAVSSIKSKKDIYLKNIADLELLEKKYNRDEFNIEVDFEQKHISYRSWLWEESKNGNQNTISASLILTEKMYLTFVFEHFGKDMDDLQVMRKLAVDTLESFSMKNYLEAESSPNSD